MSMHPKNCIERRPRGKIGRFKNTKKGGKERMSEQLKKEIQNDD
jgi:hypothetical protein